MTREEELKELEYREQKKVVVFENRDSDGFRVLCECPTCDERLNEFDEFYYCPYCGQKLDWSELDD